MTVVLAPWGHAADAAALKWAPVQASKASPLQSSDAKVEAVRDATLAAQVAGSITAVHVHAGEPVKAGQELLRIDARMASQGAAASSAQVVAAQAQAAAAAKEYERQQQLFARRYISQAALDHAQAQWQASQAQVKALQAQAALAGTQTGLHVLRAPFDGVVASVPVTLGDMALPGKPLITLIDPGALRVTAALTQAQVAALRGVTQVLVELPGAGKERSAIAMAQVQVLPTADAQSHTSTVRVNLPAQLPGAVPGAFARLWFEGAGTPGAAPRLFVPAASVVRRAEMTGVYVQDSKGQPQLRQVRLGPVAGEQIEILSGLNAGELVATEPQVAARAR
ncbi:efflux RND transporter periplasmic adaptor subunit [Comamonas sp. NLF-1-9]|uniref:efflux RND transporter periplasmic adaptor subunit n=1 Tax=Comamonas sp. NLF-1-9 TaxID=2853163 RepID=UPI0021066418|nr:efflux RND transporter periplasmic adaptor subunit [Comamonas sp. NLF-1-9]